MASRTITRWEPFSELAEIRSRFDRMLGDLAAGGAHEWTPAVDVVRDDGHLVVRALTITGKHGLAPTRSPSSTCAAERRYGAFSRSMSRPDRVDPKKVKATTHDGLLG